MSGLRFNVRPLAAGDDGALHAAVRESLDSLSYWFPWCGPGYGPADARARVEYCLHAWQQRTEFAFGIFDDSRLLGCAGLNQVDHARRSANLGYWVGVPSRGQGVATEAAYQVARFGFDELGCQRLEIAMLPENHASQRVAERIGATRSGDAWRMVPFGGGEARAMVYELTPATLRSRLTA